MMLARAAERKLRRDAFRSTRTSTSSVIPSKSSLRPSEQSIATPLLPWLNPAQSRRAATAAPSMTITANSHDARKHKATPSHLALRHDSRALATAADSHFSSPSIDFGNVMQPWSTRHQPSHYARLDRWDVTQSLILRDPVAPPTTPMRYGIGGDPTELYQNLHACLRVGLTDRAMAIIERLGKMCAPSSPEVVEAHNIFLQAMFERAEQNPTSESWTEIETWYDEHMVRNAIEPTADTLITLLRASMTFLDGYSRSAALTKYLSVAEECGPGIVEAINGSDEFSEEEWNELIECQSDKFKKPSEAIESNYAPVSTPLGYEKLVEQGLVSNPAHQVNPVPQQGLGLESLKRSLALFNAAGESVPFPHEMEGSLEEKNRAHAYARQLRIEQDSMDAAVSRWKAEDQKLQEMGIHGVLKSKPVQALMWQWYSALLPHVKKEMQRVNEVISNPSPANLRDERHIYGPYLETVSAEKVAALTVSRLVQACARGTHSDVSILKVSSLTQAIGDDVEQEYQRDAQLKHKALLKKQRRQSRRKLLDQLRLGAEQAQPEEEARSNAKAEISVATTKYVYKEFSTVAKTRIGAIALELMLKSATLTVTAEDPKTGKQLTNTQPAFHHYFNFHQGKKSGFISPHSDILEKLQKDPLHYIATKSLPMVCEPKPWSAIDDGGFYTTKSTVIRTKKGDIAQRAYAQTAISNGDMDKVLAGLDVLGKVPWQINDKIFEVMVQAWNTEEAIGGLVAEHLLSERPVEPPSDASDREQIAWIRRLKEWENEKSGLHSQRCFQNFQLEIARSYLKEDRIYFPHNVDFRGRAYPLPPLLNHIGADLARSLLRFANGKELGSVGLQWLKVQLANLYGFDKASLREREQFAMDNMSEIYDSATNPLKGRRWWAKAEDPWQCLACCMELKSALDSPDPSRYVSRLPVHQDGTCNGLQHYAALGGDHAGASQVNLEPSDRPQDIYTGVAELVKEMVAKDAENGHVQAEFVRDKITRKVVKRTVMTNVYGVTFLGAKLQVLDELKDAFPNFTPTKRIPTLGMPAQYIAGKIFMALGQIFNGAQEIQYWLGECGDRITTSLSPEQVQKIKDHYTGTGIQYYAQNKKYKAAAAAKKRHIKDSEAFKTSIIWTTPLKMPVVQPYRKDIAERVKTNLQTITVSKHSSTNSVNKRKQLQAFPPNFIHSLDATHMLLSALKCSEMGLDFAAVHDSFWTHAADIPTLNIILRDAFVRMHSEDIMGRLAAEFRARYAGHMHRVELKLTSRAANAIINWRRQHRKAKKEARMWRNVKDATFEELALEAKRQDLLNSEDPELRKQGEEMVTPTSLYQAYQDPTMFASRRLALLGEQKATQYNKIKDKILGAEAEAIQTERQASDLQSADSAPDSVVAAAIEAEVRDPNAAESDPQREASLVGVTEASIQSIKDTTVPAEGIDGEGAEEIPDATGSRTDKLIIHVWIPLSFPPVPQKGTWDVSRLHNSKYFFS